MWKMSEAWSGLPPGVSVAGVGDAVLGLGDGGIDEVDGAVAMAALVGPRLDQLCLGRLKRAQRRLHVGLIGPRGAGHGQAADDRAGEQIDGGSETMHANLQRNEERAGI